MCSRLRTVFPLKEEETSLWPLFLEHAETRMTIASFIALIRESFGTYGYGSLQLSFYLRSKTRLLIQALIDDSDIQGSALRNADERGLILSHLF